MNCPRCNQQIPDGMAFCPACGMQVGQANPYQAPYAPKAYNPQDVAKVEDYCSSASTVLVMGILSLVLCLGIGLIFMIIGLAKSGKFNKIDAMWEATLPYELKDKLNSAKRKARVGSILTGVGMIILGVCIIAIFLGL